MNSAIDIHLKKKLEKDIKKLEEHQYIEILNIIKKNHQKYTVNSTGIFFNLKYINDTTILEIISFVEFCQKNKVFLQEKNAVNKNTITPEHLKLTNKNDYTLDNLAMNIQDIFDDKTVSKLNNFTFKNYLDKISVVPKKEFKNKNSDHYPELININSNFTGSNNRVLKKCKNYDNIYSKFLENNNSTEMTKIVLEPEAHI